MNPLGFCILFVALSQKILQKRIHFLQYFFIQTAGLVYHHALACISSATFGLDIIKPQRNARWRVMRYKGGEPPLMICTTLRAAMICQAYGNPQSSASSLRGTPTAAWIKKFREQSSRNFLAEKERFELSRRLSRPTPLAGAPLRPT